MDNITSVNLASQLREGTKKSHSMAENVGFVKCFLKGVVEKNSYRKLVSNCPRPIATSTLMTWG